VRAGGCEERGVDVVEGESLVTGFWWLEGCWCVGRCRGRVRVCAGSGIERDSVLGEGCVWW